MNTVVCCNRCFEQIALRDTSAAKLWLDLCVYAAKMGMFGFVESRMPGSINPLRTLESMGYLKSADGFDMVKMRMMGHEVLTAKNRPHALDTFCICREEHGHDWQ